MPQAKGIKDKLCGVCRTPCKGSKGVRIHMAKQGSCRRVMQARVQKNRPRIRADAMAPPENTEDDPPMDWDAEVSNGEGVSAAEFRRSRHQDHEAVSGTVPAQDDHASPSETTGEAPGTDEDEVFTAQFPHPAGLSMGTGRTVFEELRLRQNKGELGAFGPFVDKDEWELAEWLLQCGASQTEIDKYLRLNIVCVHGLPSFTPE